MFKSNPYRSWEKLFQIEIPCTKFDRPYCAESDIAYNLKADPDTDPWNTCKQRSGSAQIRYFCASRIRIHSNLLRIWILPILQHYYFVCYQVHKTKSYVPTRIVSSWATNRFYFNLYSYWFVRIYEKMLTILVFKSSFISVFSLIFRLFTDIPLHLR
jgi:hypothetical protein